MSATIEIQFVDGGALKLTVDRHPEERLSAADAVLVGCIIDIVRDHLMGRSVHIAASR